MLSLTRKCDYALVALAELAHCGRRTVSARDIATKVGVPLPVLTNVLHRLQRWGLVHSKKGARGGYSLARPPHQITMAEVIDAIDGGGRLTPCCHGEHSAGCDDSAAEAKAESDCNLEAACRIREPMLRIQHGLREYFSSVTLEHLAFESGLVQLGVPTAVPSPEDLAEGIGQVHKD